MVNGAVIPDPNIRVRIRHATGLFMTAIRADDGSQNLVLMQDFSPSITQWFSIVPTDDTNSSGKYGVFSIMDDSNLFSITVAFPIGDTVHAVGLLGTDQVPPGSTSVNQWFNFPTSSDATQFQIIDPVSGCPLYPTNPVDNGDTGMEWQVGLGTVGATDAMAWFDFEYEGMTFDHMDLNIAGATMATPTLLALATHTVDNSVPGGPDQDPSVTLSHDVTTESTYSLTNSVSLTASVEVTAGVPEVASGKVGLSATTTQDITWGKTNSETKTVTLTVPVDTPSGKIITATLVAKQTTLDVPFNAVYKGTVSGALMTVPGVYTGTPVYDVDVTYTPGTVST